MENEQQRLDDRQEDTLRRGRWRSVAARKTGLFLLLLLACLYTSGWVFRSQMYFSAEDSFSSNYWAWQGSYGNFFHVLPTGEHDDRPIGWIYSKATLQLCGFNYHAQIVGYLLLQYINVILLFFVLKRLFASELWAFLGSFWFATYAPALHAVVYISAAGNLPCLALMLISILLFLRGGRVNSPLSALTYFLSIRAKECSIGLPLVLFLLQWSADGFALRWDALWKALRKCWLFACVLLLFGGALAARFFSAVGHHGVYAAGGAENPYAMVVSPRVFCEGLAYYLDILSYGLGPYFAMTAFVATLAAGIVWRRTNVVVGGVGFVIILMPMIFLVNHRWELYLYIPLAFFIIYLVGLVEWATSALARPGYVSQRQLQWAALVVVCGAALVLVQAPASKTYRNWQEELAQPYSQLAQFLSRDLPKVEPSTHFYLLNMPNAKEAFHQAIPDGCEVDMLLRLFYRDRTLKAFGQKSAAELSRIYAADQHPRVLINFDNRQFTLAAADHGSVSLPLLLADVAPELRIDDYGPREGSVAGGFNRQADKRSAFFVRGVGIRPSVVVVWNGTPLETVIFVDKQCATAAVPNGLFPKAGTYKVHLLDTATQRTSPDVPFVIADH